MKTLYKRTTVAGAMPHATLAPKFDSCSTSLNLHYQIVLRVAGEASWIEEDWRLPFYKYLASCVKTCGGTVEAIGGAPNEVRLLTALRPTKALAEFLRELKLLSQTWARRKMQILHFSWQDEIETFTVGAEQREQIKAGIQRQNSNYQQSGWQQRRRQKGE